MNIYRKHLTIDRSLIWCMEVCIPIKILQILKNNIRGKDLKIYRIENQIKLSLLKGCSFYFWMNCQFIEIWPMLWAIVTSQWSQFFTLILSSTWMPTGASRCRWTRTARWATSPSRPELSRSSTAKRWCTSASGPAGAGSSCTRARPSLYRLVLWVVTGIVRSWPSCSFLYVFKALISCYPHREGLLLGC